MYKKNPEKKKMLNTTIFFNISFLTNHVTLTTGVIAAENSNSHHRNTFHFEMLYTVSNAN